MPVINGINMTNEKAFRYQWKWYYDHRCTRKKSFFEQNEVDNIPLHMCYACKEAGTYKDEFGDERTNCKNCPVRWGTEGTQDNFFCEYVEGKYCKKTTLYDRWSSQKLDFTKRMDAALELSQVEWEEKE